jgi:hypothetical protein
MTSPVSPASEGAIAANSTDRAASAAGRYTADGAGLRFLTVDC